MCYAKKIMLAATMLGGFCTVQGMEFNAAKLEQAIQAGNIENVRMILKNLTVAGPKETMSGEKLGEPLKARLVMTVGGEYKTVPVPSSQTQGAIPVKMEMGTRVALDKEGILTHALIEAIRHDQLSVVKLLVDELGANVRSKKGIHGNLSTTPLGFALQLQDQGDNREQIIHFLLSKGS